MSTEVLDEEEFEDGPPKLQPISTTCRDCIFAEWAGTTQTGCEWDRLEKFEENGADIVGMDDGQKQFFIISGRFCNYVRNHEWGEKHPHKDWANIVQDHAKVRCSMIVYADDKSSLVDVERSLTSIIEQDMRAWNLVLVLNQTKDEPRVYRRLINSMEPQLPWELRQIMIQSDLEGNEYVAEMNEAIDLTVVHCKATYYAVARAGYQWPTNFISTLERAVNEDLTRFIALLPDNDGNGMLVQTILHNTIKGSKIKDVLDKVLEIAAEESTGHMIKRFEHL